MAPGGYAWWYLDADSDDGEHALTLIAFVGSVFSPHYAAAVRAGGGNPRNHVAINVALYGRHKRWSFVEAAQQQADARQLQVGGSLWQQTDDGLIITINERTTPWSQPLRGTVRLRGTPTDIHAQQVLAAQGRHVWWPLVPHARVEADFEAPRLRWQGRGYHDINWGDEPLAAAFRRWDWMRVATQRSTQVYFRLEPRVRAKDATVAQVLPAGPTQLALEIDDGQSVRHVAQLKSNQLSRSRWGLTRHALGPVDGAELVEDTPFYARSRMARPDGARIMHESLDLDRWRSGWVQALLKFRLRRS